MFYQIVQDSICNAQCTSTMRQHTREEFVALFNIPKLDACNVLNLSYDEFTAQCKQVGIHRFVTLILHMFSYIFLRWPYHPANRNKKEIIFVQEPIAQDPSNHKLIQRSKSISVGFMKKSNGGDDSKDIKLPSFDELLKSCSCSQPL